LEELTHGEISNRSIVHSGRPEGHHEDWWNGAARVCAAGGGERRREARGAIFCLGDYDAFAIVDLPDHVSAAALSLAVTASGAARTKTTALLTPEEVDQAVKKTVKYRPPNA
jgi:hypothetical protein